MTHHDHPIVLTARILSLPDSRFFSKSVRRTCCKWRKAKSGRNFNDFPGGFARQTANTPLCCRSRLAVRFRIRRIYRSFAARGGSLSADTADLCCLDNGSRLQLQIRDRQFVSFQTNIPERVALADPDGVYKDGMYGPREYSQARVGAAARNNGLAAQLSACGIARHLASKL